MTYQGMFLRDQLGQTPGTAPAGEPSLLTSPDVIPNGTSPATNPGVFTSTAGYAAWLGSPLYAGRTNYLYVRGLNAASGALAGRFWLYHLPANLELGPQNWAADGIQVAGEARNWVEVDAQSAGAISVGAQPFEWSIPPLAKPDAPGPAYCLVAIAENPPLSQPPAPPVPAGFSTTWHDLAEFLVSHPSAAARCVVDVSSELPSWTHSVAAGAVPGGGALYCGLQITGLPLDGYWALRVVGEDGKVLIDTGKSPVTDTNMNYTVPIDWPANYQATLTVDWWNGGTSPPAGATIVPTFLQPSPGQGAATPGATPGQSVQLVASIVYRFYEPGPGAG